jgi:CheY-like chemotaxis protein
MMMTQHGRRLRTAYRSWRVGKWSRPIAKQNQPDAILLDVMMPAMDGPAMLGKLRATRATSHIPIVLLTAKVQAVHDGSLSHLPVAAILPKPFDPLRLASQVADALGWEKE